MQSKDIFCVGAPLEDSGQAIRFNLCETQRISASILRANRVLFVKKQIGKKFGKHIFIATFGVEKVTKPRSRPTQNEKFQCVKESNPKYPWYEC